MPRFYYDIWVYKYWSREADGGARVYIEAEDDHAEARTDGDGHVQLWLDLSWGMPASLYIRGDDMGETVEPGKRNTVYTR